MKQYTLADLQEEFESRAFVTVTTHGWHGPKDISVYYSDVEELLEDDGIDLDDTRAILKHEPIEYIWDAAARKEEEMNEALSGHDLGDY